MVIIFVNRIGYVVTRSNVTKYGTAQHCPDTKTPPLFKLITQVLDVYQSLGYRVTNILMGGQFKPICALLVQ